MAVHGRLPAPSCLFQAPPVCHHGREVAPFNQFRHPRARGHCDHSGINGWVIVSLFLQIKIKGTSTA